MEGSMLSELNKRINKLKEETRVTDQNIESLLKARNHLLLGLDNLKEKRRRESPPGHNRMIQELVQYCAEIVQKYREFCISFARLKARNSGENRKELEYLYKRHVMFFQRLKGIQDRINHLEYGATLRAQNSDSECPDR